MTTDQRITDLLIATRFWLLRRAVRWGASLLFLVGWFYILSGICSIRYEPRAGLFGPVLQLGLGAMIFVLSFWAFMSLKPLAALVTGVIGIASCLIGISSILAAALPILLKAKWSDLSNPVVQAFAIPVVVMIIVLLLFRIMIIVRVTKPSRIVLYLIDGMLCVFMLLIGLAGIDAIYAGAEGVGALPVVLFLFILLLGYTKLIVYYSRFSKLREVKPDKKLVDWVGGIVSEIKGANLKRSTDIIELRVERLKYRVKLGIDLVTLLLPEKVFEVPIFIAKTEFKLGPKESTIGKRSVAVSLRIRDEDVVGLVSTKDLQKYLKWANQ